MSSGSIRQFRRIARGGCGDVHLCITINNNVGGGQAVNVESTLEPSEPDVVAQVAPSPTPPGATFPPLPPDPTLPLPFLRGTAVASDPAVAPVYMKGLVPHIDQGALLTAGPYVSGDSSKQSRYRVNSSSVTTTAPYGDTTVSSLNRVSVFMTAAIDANGQIYKGFACARAHALTPGTITMITDMTTVGTATTAKNHVYATHDVTSTAASVTLSTPSPMAATTLVTFATSVAAADHYIVLMPEKVLTPGAGASFTSYLSEGAIHHQPAGSVTVDVPRPSTGWATGKTYFAFVVKGDPRDRTSVTTVLSAPTKFTVG